MEYKLSHKPRLRLGLCSVYLPRINLRLVCIIYVHLYFVPVFGSQLNLAYTACMQATQRCQMSHQPDQTVYLASFYRVSTLVVVEELCLCACTCRSLYL